MRPVAFSFLLLLASASALSSLGSSLGAQVRQLSRAPITKRSIWTAEYRHVALAGMQAGALGGISDAVSQRMHALPVDFAHVSAMAVLACLLSGALNAVWMRDLESRFPGPTKRAVALKTITDYCCCATSFNAAFLIFVPFLTAVFDGSSPEWAPLESFNLADFASLMRLEACTFVPYNLCAFRLLPVDLRPLGSASLSAVCTIILSGVTLGYTA